MFKDLVEFCVVSLDLLNARANGFKTAGGGPLLSSTYKIFWYLYDINYINDTNNFLLLKINLTIQSYWDTLAKTSLDEPHGKNANDTSASISVASNLSLSVRKGLAIRSFEMDSVRTF